MKLSVLIFILPAVFADTRTTFNTRIVNGQNADPNEYPWQVSLQFWSEGTQQYAHICGAVVLDSNRILTAAHCVHHDATASKYEVVVGEHELSKDSGDEQRRSVTTIIMHPDYNPSGGYNNDVAVLILASSITLNDVVQSAALPVSSQNFDGTNCYISGWGRTKAGGNIPDILQEAETTVITHNNCRSQLGLTGLLYLSSRDHICIYSGSNSACNGDSGGPLVCNVSGTWVLAGVTSWGLVDCPVGSPSVYARITTYLNWIAQQ